MKKMNLTFILLFICMYLIAPPVDRPIVYIPTAQIVVDPQRIDYEPLIKAIVQWESKGNHFAFNALENAVGAFQIRQCRIDHYNQLAGTNYTLEDCYDYSLSKRIFMYFAYGKDWERAAKDWNGSGPMTVTYWENVKKLI